MEDKTIAKLEAAMGAALVPTPLWVILVQDVSMIAGMVAAVCGAIIGVHGVWRLWCRHCDEKKKDQP